MTVWAAVHTEIGESRYLERQSSGCQTSSSLLDHGKAYGVGEKRERQRTAMGVWIIGHAGEDVQSNVTPGKSFNLDIRLFVERE